MLNKQYEAFVCARGELHAVVRE